jgi:hypothetical protein
MAGRITDEDDWDEDDGDGEDEQDTTIPCPYCRQPIHEDSQRCPHCEQYISQEDAPPSRKPWWLLVGVLLCLYAVYRWIAG